MLTRWMLVTTSVVSKFQFWTSGGAREPEHPQVATSLENYAALLRETARADEAETLVVRAKAIRGKAE